MSALTKLWYFFFGGNSSTPRPRVVSFTTYAGLRDFTTYAGQRNFTTYSS